MRRSVDCSMSRFLSSYISAGEARRDRGSSVWWRLFLTQRRRDKHREDQKNKCLLCVFFSASLRLCVKENLHSSKSLSLPGITKVMIHQYSLPRKISDP